MKKVLLLSILSLFVFTAFASVPGSFAGLQEKISSVEPGQNELRIYPNPTETGQVTLEMNTGEIAEVRLINIAGKEVVVRKIEFGAQKYVLPLDNLPNGIYFIRVQSTENKTVVKKLVVASR